MYAPAFTMALEQIGHQVTRFNFDDHLPNTKISSLELRLGFGPGLAYLNHKLLSAVRDADPDICMVWTGLGIWPTTIRSMKKKCWVTSYTNDDPFGSRGRAAFWRLFHKAIPVYNSHHVYREINIDEYRAMGAETAPIGLLRSYYVPWFHFPENIEKAASSQKVVFVGHGERNRFETLSAIKRAGISVDIYGSPDTWKCANGVEIRALETDQYRQLISRSAINLAFLSRANRDQYTRRYFEIPACGGFLLGERTETVQALYDEGKECDFFSDDDEAVAKALFYVNNPHIRERIAQAGLTRCIRSGYDVLSVCRGWIEDICSFQSGRLMYS